MVPPWSSENQSFLIFPSSSDLRSFHFHPESTSWSQQGSQSEVYHINILAKKKEEQKGMPPSCQLPLKTFFSGKLLTAFSWPEEADFKLERTDRWIREGRGRGGMKWKFALESAFPPQIPGRFFPLWLCVRLGLSQLLPFYTRADQHHTHTGPCCCHQKGIRCWAPPWTQPFGPLSPSQVSLLGTGATEVQRQVGYRCWGARQNWTPTVYLEFHVNSLWIWMDKKTIRFDKM